MKTAKSLITLLFAIVMSALLSSAASASELNYDLFRAAVPMGEATEIYFGRTDQYTVSGSGTPVSEDGGIQLFTDGTVYYVLSDLQIEFPEDASGLFGIVVFDDFGVNYNENESLTDISFNNVDTSNVIYMSCMFCGCVNLRNIDFGSFVTFNVTDMSQMFSGCENLTELNLGSFDTSNVTEMYEMFYGCKNLGTIFVTEFFSANSECGADMFLGCESLAGGAGTEYDESKTDSEYARIDGGTSEPGYFTRARDCLDASKFRIAVRDDAEKIYFGTEEKYEDIVSRYDEVFSVSKYGHINAYRVNYTTYYILSDSTIIFPEESPGFFSEYLYLDTLVFDNISTSGTTNMDAMFAICRSLKSLDLSGFDTSKVTDMSDMFSGCKSLKSIDLSSFNTCNVEYMTQMFNGCSSLTVLDLSVFNTNKVHTMHFMFAGCTDLKTILASDNFTTEIAPKYAVGMFSDCTSLKGGNGTEFDNEWIDISAAWIDGKAGHGGYFTAKADLDIEMLHSVLTDDVTKIYFGTNAQYADKITGNTASFASADGTVRVYNEGTEYYVLCDKLILFPKDSSGMLMNYSSLESVVFDNICTFGVESMKEMFSGCQKLSDVDFSAFSTVTVKDMNRMFWACQSLTDLDISGFDTLNVKDMGMMFGMCTALESLDLSTFDTSNVTDMNDMFNNCEMLKSVNLSFFDTSVVTQMCGMFCGCENLTSLDLSSFDTYCVNDMSYMFGSCTALKTIYVSEAFGRFNEDRPYGDYMFSDCISLVGGKGTIYDSSWVDYESARIDGRDGEYGYFTCLTCGDVTDDGMIEAEDALLIARFVAGWDVSINEKAADIDKDGEITPRDSMIIARYNAEWEGYKKIPYRN